MPYNPETIKNMLPNPGFTDEDLKGRESSSFKEPQNVGMTAFMNVHGAIAGSYRKKTDDLTFIIPYATSDDERYWALCATVGWIISTTTAKIILMSAENEETFNNFRNPENFTNDIVLDWKQYSDPDFQISKKQTHILSEIHLDFCKKFCAGHFLAEDYSVKVWEDPILANEYLKRISVMVEPRLSGEPFHRTKYLNMMLDKTETKFVCNHDADTILSMNGVSTSMSYLRMGIANVVYPYARAINSQKRVFFKEAAPPSPLSTLILTGDMSSLLYEGLGILEWPASYGQSIFFEVSSYKAIQGENEEFISWAPEDLERYERCIKMGLTVARVECPIVHLEHPRGVDSSEANKKFKDNLALYDRLSNLSLQELQDYYSSVEYRGKYKW